MGEGPAVGRARGLAGAPEWLHLLYHGSEEGPAPSAEPSVRPPTLLAAAFIFRGRELLAAFAAIAQVWVVLAFLDVLVQADLALVVFRRRGLVVDDPVSLQPSSQIQGSYFAAGETQDV